MYRSAYLCLRTDVQVRQSGFYQVKGRGLQETKGRRGLSRDEDRRAPRTHLPSAASLFLRLRSSPLAQVSPCLSLWAFVSFLLLFTFFSVLVFLSTQSGRLARLNLVLVVTLIVVKTEKRSTSIHIHIFAYVRIYIQEYLHTSLRPSNTFATLIIRDMLFPPLHASCGNRLPSLFLSLSLASIRLQPSTLSASFSRLWRISFPVRRSLRRTLGFFSLSPSFMTISV